MIRNETESGFRSLLLYCIGGVAGLLIAFCLGNSLGRVAWASDFLSGQGAVLFLVGLLYASAFIGLQDSDTERGYHASLGLGAVGIVGLAIGLVRSFWPESTFLVPAGLVLIGMSLLYIAVALAICVDWPIIVLTRRDLAAYFYSPVAYLVLIGQLLFGWLMFFLFVQKIVERGTQGVMFEPIIGHYIFDIFPVIVQMFVVPALTMRLLSEEKRTGTLEVMLTAPVNEISVVLGKFLACWIFYMLLWMPWWLFLVSLRYMGNEEFDYRPVLSFMVAMGATSAGFLAMGLFFSSLTSNQIIAAVFTFVGMMAHLAFYIVKFLPFVRQGSAVSETLTFINFLDFWMTSLDGILAPRYLIFHLSVAAFFLFATIKVLESRKWA